MFTLYEQFFNFSQLDICVLACKVYPKHKYFLCILTENKLRGKTSWRYLKIFCFKTVTNLSKADFGKVKYTLLLNLKFVIKNIN